ncbi:hypothetical protein D3C81_1439730 [compost metagenome]
MALQGVNNQLGNRCLAFIGILHVAKRQHDTVPSHGPLHILTVIKAVTSVSPVRLLGINLANVVVAVIGCVTSVLQRDNHVVIQVGEDRVEPVAVGLQWPVFLLHALFLQFLRDQFTQHRFIDIAVQHIVQAFICRAAIIKA